MVARQLITRILDGEQGSKSELIVEYNELVHANIRKFNEIHRYEFTQGKVNNLANSVFSALWEDDYKKLKDWDESDESEEFPMYLEGVVWQTIYSDDAKERFVDEYIDLIYSAIQHFNVIHGFPFRPESVITPSASDVATDILLKVWDDDYRILSRKWKPEKGSFSTYLWKIVQNYCYDLLRRMVREGGIRIVSLNEPIHDEDGKPIERWETIPDDGIRDPLFQLVQLEDEEEYRRMVEEVVQQVLGKLNDKQRLVLFLYYGKGLKYKEISESTGIPMGTIASILHNAKKKILMELLKKGIDSSVFES